jgi:hypothetical protein
MGYSVTHVIDTDVDNLWRLLLDVELADTMLKSFGVPGSYEIVEEREDEQGRLHRRVECNSLVELPGFVTKLVGDGSYTEIGCFDRTFKKYSAQCIPKRGADKVLTSYEITARPLDDGTRCERLIVTENVVKVFGIGGLIQSMLERTQRDAHEQSATFINSWLRSNPGP